MQSLINDSTRWENVDIKQNYGISRWEKAHRINQRLQNLTSQPIYALNDSALQSILDYFDNNCAKSKQITTQAQNFIPGGVQHNLAFNYPFPICVAKAEGAYLYDIDGNRYYDFLQAGGATILGNNCAVVREKVIELLQTCGPVTGLFHETELLIAQEINKHMPNVEKFRMLGSGTESVMGALRVARCATGKKRIIKIGGAYHGWSDQMVYGVKVAGTRQFLESHGIPNNIFSQMYEVQPNNLDMLEDMLIRNRKKGGTAAVILEPLGAESGTRAVDFLYNKGVRALCDKYNSLLIFDEVVTGFRVGLGGAQGFFDVVPDLTVFGKIVAGGYPSAGGIGGKKEYVDCLAAGVATGAKKAYVGGTLAANPLSSYAGYCTIQQIESTNACVKAGQAGDRLADGLQVLVEKHKLPYVVYNQGSIVHLECSGAMNYDFSSFNLLKSLCGVLKNKSEILLRKVAMEHMGAAYMANGIATLAGSRLYTSLSDTDQVIDEVLNKFDDVFAVVTKGESMSVLLRQQKNIKKQNKKLTAATKRANNIVRAEKNRLKSQQGQKDYALITKKIAEMRCSDSFEENSK